MAPWLVRELDDQIVEPLGRDAGLDVLGQHVERAGGELAGLAHALEGLAAVQPDLGVARLGAVEVEVVHVAFGALATGRAAACRPMQGI